MTDLYPDTITLPSADLGAENPLPPIGGDASLAKTSDLTAANDAIRANAAYGRVPSIAPYLIQDGYDRRRTKSSHAALVLRNEHLTATFLPSLGGRLWSLVDRATGRRLLHANPVFQPANLALRGAWFAGGVEWNIGTIGHSPLTCAPLHAVRLTANDGSPVLRMYEFERLRRVVYQLDVHLPAGSRNLFVHVRITNPNAQTVPMYWWSNIAVPQTAGTRVFVPAERAYNYSYDNVLRHEPIAPGAVRGAGIEYDDCPDISYPARFSDAADFFFDLGGQEQPWIAAVDAGGAGLLQTSTARLAGRKLFRWGTSAGGRRWQEWLSGPVAGPTDGYVEIQAGLATTQFEHLPMPAGVRWSWTESYGPVALDPAAAAGPWPQARDTARGAVTDASPAGMLAGVHAAAEALADAAPEEILAIGSGWGAFERHLRVAAGEPAVDFPGTPFPDESLTAAQEPWLALLRGADYPDPESGELPGSMHCHPVLLAALSRSAGWAAPALAGAALAAGGRWEAAAAAWRESLSRRDNPLAHRNLAVAALRRGESNAAAAQYRAAFSAMTPPAATASPAAEAAYRSVAVEALAVLATADPASAVEVAGRLPRRVAGLGRVRMLTARAALATGDADRCLAILADPALEVADLREGEASLDELWFDARAAVVAAGRGVVATPALRAEVERSEALPAHLDFRMKPGIDRVGSGEV